MMIKRRETTVSMPGEHLAVPPPQEITQFMQAHPYEYLRELNSTYNYYSKSYSKCYSSASRIKLPWKQFKVIKIPQCFKQTFMQEKRQSQDNNVKHIVDQSGADKKLWKEHAEIIQRYSNKNKNKQGLPIQTCSSSQSRLNKRNNKLLAQRVVSQDRKNLFLKKIIEKGANLNYDSVEIQQQVITNLAKIRENCLYRAKTAGHRPSKPNSSFNKKVGSTQTITESKQNIQKKTAPRVENYTYTDFNEYLEFDKKKSMIQTYQRRITHIDCSISQKNIKNAIDILKEMQKIAQK